jgi:hypothetical protein
MRVKVQTLGILANLLVGLGGGGFVLLIPKSPLETLLASPTAESGRSVQVFQTCTLTGAGVRVCRAVVKVCTMTKNEEWPPIRCREAYPRRTDRTGEPA